MARTDNAGLAGTLFARVADDAFGYDTGQVEDFLARARKTYEAENLNRDVVTSSVVRRATFDPARGGYDPREVDAALDRLEDVFAARERNALIESEGHDRWLENISQVAMCCGLVCIERRGSVSAVHPNGTYRPITSQTSTRCVTVSSSTSNTMSP